MPDGLVRTDLNIDGTTFLHGTPVAAGAGFGTDITEPKQFGATVPPSDSTFNSNVVNLPLTIGNVFTGPPA